MLSTLIKDQGERMTLESIVSDTMVQEVAEMIAYSGIFGEPIDMSLVYEEEQKQAEVKASKPKKARKVNPNRKVKGKTKAAAAGSSQDFWIAHGDDAIIMATDDDQLKDSQPEGGNYEKTKKFLMTDWAEKEFFTRTEIEKALTEKYPEESMYNSKSTFRLSHRGWATGIYYVNTGELAIKPIYKRVGRGKLENIFYAGA